MRVRWLLLAIVGAAAACACASQSISIGGSPGLWHLYHHGQDRRYGQIVLPLQDGRVLVTSGGLIAASRGALTATTEIFDPRSGAWTPAQDIPVPGVGQTAVQLADGTVLVAGGLGLAPDRFTAPPITGAAQLFTPSTGTWMRVADLRVPRYDAAAVVLPNGQAMVIGGTGAGTGQANAPTGPVAPGTVSSGSRLGSVELFDPSTHTWQAKGNLVTARSSPIALVLGDGRVLVMGGFGPIGPDEANALQSVYSAIGGSATEGPILTSDVYNSTTGQWTGFHLSFPATPGEQVITSAYKAASGRVIGMSTNLLTAATIGRQEGIPTERYPFVLDPSTGSVNLGPADPDTLSTVFASQIGMPAGLLPDGALVVSGAGRNFLYDPDRQTWSTVTTSPLQPGLGGHAPVVLISGLVLTNVGDQWAVLNPNATITSHQTAAIGLDSPVVSWWLTLAVLLLAIVVGLQFLLTRLGAGRLVGPGRLRPAGPDKES